MAFIFILRIRCPKLQTPSIFQTSVRMRFSLANGDAFSSPVSTSQARLRKVKGRMSAESPNGLTKRRRGKPIINAFKYV